MERRTTSPPLSKEEKARLIKEKQKQVKERRIIQKPDQYMQEL